MVMAFMVRMAIAMMLIATVKVMTMLIEMMTAGCTPHVATNIRRLRSMAKLGLRK